MRDDAAIDTADLLAVVIFIGLGMTSAILAWVPGDAEAFAPAAADALAALEGESRPDEILVAGVGLEAMVFSGALDAEVDGEPGPRLRLVPADRPLSLSRSRYWIISRSGTFGDLGGDDEVAGVPAGLPRGYGVDARSESGGIEALAVSAAGPASALRLVDMVRGADARFVATGPGANPNDSIPCASWRFGRLMCGPNEWNYVGATEVAINGRPEQCIWAHPFAGHELRVSFADLPLGAGLRGRYAFADSAVEDPGGRPVNFRVLVDGEEKVKRVVANRRGWNRFDVRPRDLGRGGDGGTEPASDDAGLRGTVTFVIAAESDGRRHFCFDAELGTPGPS